MVFPYLILANKKLVRFAVFENLAVSQSDAVSVNKNVGLQAFLKKIRESYS